MGDNQPRILVVDDRQENLFAMKTILRKLDAELVCATSGDEALRLSLEQEFCLAIVDVQMPEMDGYELVELLRSNANTSALPVIFVSAIFSDEYHYRKGYDAGAVDFLSKPVNADILLSKVRVFIQLWQQKLELQNLVSSLQDWNTYLEKTVRERTEAVKSENAALAGQLKFQEELIHLAAGELRAALAALHHPVTRLESAVKNQPAGREQLREPLRKIQAGEKQLYETITALGDFPRLGDGLANLSRRPVALHELVASVCSECHEIMDARNLTISVENLSQLPAVQADEGLLRLLVYQVGQHALSHSQEGGEVVISGEQLPAGYYNQVNKESVRLKFAFQSPSADREYQQWIACVFTQDASAARENLAARESNGNATSLGLAMAKKIVEAHGGMIWPEVRKAEEKGSAGVILHVVLPV